MWFTGILLPADSSIFRNGAIELIGKFNIKKDESKF